MADTTYYEYVSALKKLFVIQDIEAWCPAIRSKSALQASDKKELVDPSLAVAALGADPDYFNLDLKTFGFIFVLEIERLIAVYNEKETQAKLRAPDLKLVITGTQYGYQRPDGVCVIPIGVLRN